MSKRTLATVIIGAALIVPAEAQRSSRHDVVDESTVTRTLSFAAGGGRMLDVRNINGFIHVEGTNDATVQMSIRKVIRADTRDDLAEAQRDGRLDFREGSARVEATVTDRRGHICGEPWNDDRGRWERVHYHVQYDFTIRVPRDAALRLCTINSGEVIVSGTQGDFDVDNVNGPIQMKDVGGAGTAHTVNGPVTVTFTANPRRESSFKTVNGNVDVTFRDGLGAEFVMKTFNGGLFTDFDAQPIAIAAPVASERRNGRFVYRGNEFTRVRVGNGGPQITFETLNGNVRARKGQ
ncbi:MAG TPA: hypothetical protein VJ691_17375 [Vicinamibacterales bacterium]|nr:hypothetical protein [Vicinamibacterales bacterium]